MSTVGTDASRSFANFYEIMILALCQAITNTEFAVIHALVYLFALAAGQTEIIIKTITWSIELVADVSRFWCRIKVRKSDTFAHGIHFGHHLQFRTFFDSCASFWSVWVQFIIFFDINHIVEVVKTYYLASQAFIFVLALNSADFI